MWIAGICSECYFVIILINDKHIDWRSLITNLMERPQSLSVGAMFTVFQLFRTKMKYNHLSQNLQIKSKYYAGSLF